MTQLLPDQAEGLRRLFQADVRRMITVLSPAGDGVGHEFAAGLATALAGQGRKVLLLDESLAAGERHPVFGATARHDLATVMLHQAEIDKAILCAMPGIDLLAGGGQSGTLPRPRMEARIGLVNAFYRLAGKYDVVLVDAGADGVHSRPSFAWACQDVIMLCGNQPDASTAVYSHIKSLHQAGERRFHLLFSGMSAERAQALYRSIATVSRRHLQVMPEMLGVLPAAGDLPSGYFAQLADSVLTWPLPAHKAGHFPALMRRLLGGANAPRTLSATAK